MSGAMLAWQFFLSALDLEPNEFPRWAEITAFTDEQVGAFTSEVGHLLSAECGTFAFLCSVSKDGVVKVGLRAVAGTRRPAAPAWGPSAWRSS